MADDLRPIDHILKEVYGDALREQLERGKSLLEKLGVTPPDITPYPRWKWFLISAKERLNSCYMHLRYGYCDDKKEWYDHVC